MSDEKHFKDAAPDQPACDFHLTYEPELDAYWFDHGRQRVFIYCRRASHPEDKGVSLKEMADFSLAFRNGHIVVQDKPPSLDPR